MRRYWILFTLLVALSCSDDSTGPGSSAPVISNLQFSPEFVYVTSMDTPGVQISGSFDFIDLDGDVVLFHLATSGGGEITLPLEGLAGITRGSLIGTFLFPPAPVGQYGMTVWIKDAQGHQSNELSGTFGVRIDDTGTGWTARPSGTRVQLNKVVRGVQGYLAVGYGGVILHSPDGLVWTARLSGTENVLWGAAWSGFIHVVVGDQGTICTSADGASWISHVPSQSAGTLRSVAWSGSRFVAVGDKRVSAETEILTSADGISWETLPSMPGIRDLRAVTWADDRFLAAGTGNGDSTVLVSSPDGSAWMVDATMGPLFPRDIFWSGTTAIVIGGAGAILRSQDKIHWQRIQTGALSLSAVTWSGSQFTAVGTGIYTSADGSAWQQNSQEQGLQSVVWAEIRYIAAGGGGVILTSP